MSNFRKFPEEVFEFFDFKIGDDGYVGFQTLEGYDVSGRWKGQNEIRNKLDACKGKVVIINTLHDREMQITTSKDGRIAEIPYSDRTDFASVWFKIIEEVLRKGYLRWHQNYNEWAKSNFWLWGIRKNYHFYQLKLLRNSSKSGASFLDFSRELICPFNCFCKW